MSPIANDVCHHQLMVAQALTNKMASEGQVNERTSKEEPISYVVGSTRGDNNSHQLIREQSKRLGRQQNGLAGTKKIMIISS